MGEPVKNAVKEVELPMHLIPGLPPPKRRCDHWSMQTPQPIPLIGRLPLQRIPLQIEPTISLEPHTCLT